MGEWISVKDRMPESGVNVAACMETAGYGKRVIVASYGNRGKRVSNWRDGNSHYVVNAPITYWMPLPEPPK